MSTGYWGSIEPFWERLSPAGNEDYSARTVGVPHWIRLLNASHWVGSEVCNGGFHQLFHNPTGVLAPDGVLGFEAIGMPNTASLVGQAIALLGSPFPSNQKERQVRLAAVKQEAFEPLEERFFKVLETESGGFGAAADNHAARMGA